MIAFVSGLSRCGTSLAMQMLDAGGIRCAGAAPDFEVQEMNKWGAIVSDDFLRAHDGCAIKFLDPHKVRVNPSSWRAAVIWLDRDLQQQSQSQAKFVNAMSSGKLKPTAQAIRTVEQGLPVEREQALSALKSWPILFVKFEEILDKPIDIAGKITNFLAPWFNAPDPRRMASVVRPRSSECAPTMAIEMDLMAKFGRR